jgi:hypothetical protein
MRSIRSGSFSGGRKPSKYMALLGKGINTFEKLSASLANDIHFDIAIGHDLKPMNKCDGY